MTTRASRLAAVLFLVSAAPLAAHPGVGIVMDRRGNVFYTDLKQVWKITPDGRKTVAVPEVHSHELCLDERGNLYGEHLWYEGEATNKWGHRVWRLGTDGALAPMHGFPGITICATDSWGRVPNFHRHSDTPDRVDPDVVERAIAYAEQIVRQIDARLIPEALPSLQAARRSSD